MRKACACRQATSRRWFSIGYVHFLLWNKTSERRCQFFGLDAATLRSSLKKADELTHGWAALPSIKIRELVRSIVERVCVRVDDVVVSLNRKEIAENPNG